jgi:hypothetical protein
MIETIEWNGKKFALIVRGNYEPAGVDFVTSADNPLQLGIFKHQQGTRIRPHIHQNRLKTINEVQEVLHIEYGKVRVEFYESEGQKVATTILNPCDTILLLSGGHGFNILEDSKIIEVKQGPYHGRVEDKKLI